MTLPADRRSVALVLATVLSLAACSQGGVEPPSSAPASIGAAATATGAPSRSPSEPTSTAELAADDLARTTVDGLSVRTEPSRSAERLGTLPAGQITFVIAGPVEADGYTWYQLVGLGSRSNQCGAAAPSLECADWAGWAAGTTPEGDRWLERTDAECPSTRETPTYVAMDAVSRLVCAGAEEWRLVVYLAPEAEGRGCFPVWIVDPGWMDPACALFFPQAVERQFDSDTTIQAFIPPELGECGPGGCPFDEYKGSWVEIVGHLDDPVAGSCTTVLNDQIGAHEAPPPPAPELTVFRCRLNFVVTAITETSAPSS